MRIRWRPSTPAWTCERISDDEAIALEPLDQSAGIPAVSESFVRSWIALALAASTCLRQRHRRRDSLFLAGQVRYQRSSAVCFDPRRVVGVSDRIGAGSDTWSGLSGCHDRYRAGMSSCGHKDTPARQP